MVYYNMVLLNLYSKWCVAFVSEGKAELREAVGQSWLNETDRWLLWAGVPDLTDLPWSCKTIENNTAKPY